MEFCNFFRRKLLTFSLTLLLSISPTTQQQLSLIDLNALRQIMDSLTDVRNGGFFSTWNFSSPENPCSTFAGLTCSAVNGQSRVTSLFLGTGLSDSPGLAGTIFEPGIYDLTELTQLVLYPGIVTGSIPSQIGHRLKNLRVLSLTNNRLTGTIPETISELWSLHTLDLSHNRLTGGIPPAIAASPELKVLVLADNKLVGELPEFPDESRLIHLDLRNNLLTGELPKFFPATLRYLSLSSNGLWGPLESVPSSPSSNLVYLDLSMNKFSGPIPKSLFRTGLSSMYLQRNNLSGHLPPLDSSGSYGPGSTVDLSHNFLAGQIPEYLADVETLFLNNNHFVGEVPAGYVESVVAGTMRTLYLQHNYLTSFPMAEGGGMTVPDGVALCVSYNCMVPPAVGVTACPASAGGPASRPFGQCSSGNSMG